ncbi:Serine/threonine-protein phosphatase BSL3 [Auxenochlorella protothecoides]|uniref:Serine/threonine-protein phosphatase n=1 Tax=Auxenochlorella protothecoides TaxID=3075 RepID=A0A087STQ4_AUXPR|nr:Serine/threonine-protein phosphatase BSL3 [Auxenochlorella protothecoides]KFM29108.1 Serine/threonine-protein phosphatase BSL3 [Auxenochlorella protothecoides]
MDVRTGRWEKWAPQGEPPSPRAAHAAAAVGNMVVVQGGIGPAGLASEDLHVLDFTDTEKPRWHRVAVAGPGPSARYAHTLALVANRFLVAAGGNDGKATLHDAWSLDTSEKPYAWRRVADSGDEPPARMYAAAAARSDGLLLLCGGRDVDGHGAVFVNARLHVLGGAVGGGRMVDEAAAGVALDTAVGAWVGQEAPGGDAPAAAGAAVTLVSPDNAGPGADAVAPDADAMRRCRHAVAAVGPLIFVHGGLRGSTLLEDVLLADDSGGTELTACDPRSPAWQAWINATHGMHKQVLRELLIPRHWRPPESRDFFLDADAIHTLCDQAEAIFQAEPTLLRLRAPVKIFGDLHGQFGDLMRLFEEYGTPSTSGDITYIDYLFLGDYVDRGAHSLETMCLLLALKIDHPENVHLIRGNHEASDINALFGFRLECVERLGEPEGLRAWNRFNQLFNWLPLAAVIEDKVLCMHGGIGRSIHSMEQIAELARPLTMEDGGVVLMDLLWSDPTTNDAVEGVQPSPRGPGLVTFGPDRVLEFCQANELQMIVRAHECVMDGFERFAHGRLITLFSATNYCGTANNAGAVLVLGRDLVMVPKLIHPLPPTTPRQPHSPTLAGEEIIEDPPTPHPSSGDMWMQAVNAERPPTPPRGRPSSPQSFFD